MMYRELLQRQRVLNAPMCGITDYPFRVLCREMGAELTFSQMASSEGMMRAPRRSVDLLDLGTGETGVAIQLFGGDPHALAESARKLLDLGAVAIDLNMGCPVPKVVANKAGSALLRDLPRVERIFKAMRAVIPIPFTVKMRWDWSGEAEAEHAAAVKAARMAEGEGLDAICLHARTRAQGYSGQARWDQIGTIKAAVSIPVIGNGDIREPADALAMTRQSGCDAVMIGRALIGDPWLLRETMDAFQRGNAAEGRTGPGWEVRRGMILKHATMMFERRGPRGLAMFRKHAVAYLRGLRGVRAMRDRMMHVASIEDLAAVLEDGPDPNDLTRITINTDEHEARLRQRGGCQGAAE